MAYFKAEAFKTANWRRKVILVAIVGGKAAFRAVGSGRGHGTQAMPIGRSGGIRMSHSAL